MERGAQAIRYLRGIDAIDQRDEDHSSEIRSGVPAGFHGEARLAATTRSEQGDEAAVVQEASQLFSLCLAPKERGQVSRQQDTGRSRGTRDRCGRWLRY